MTAHKLVAVISATSYNAWSLAGGCFVPRVLLSLACGHTESRRGNKVPKRARCSVCKGGS